MDQPRKISHTEYSLNGTLSENLSIIDVVRKEAGCFVLITNISTEKKSAIGLRLAQTWIPASARMTIPAK
ncbi:MAG: hypothetical protein AABZ14_02455, partial [Candidatus Margulisiibacteriota bacterium]